MIPAFWPTILVHLNFALCGSFMQLLNLGTKGKSVWEQKCEHRMAGFSHCTRCNFNYRLLNKHNWLISYNPYCKYLQPSWPLLRILGAGEHWIIPCHNLHSSLNSSLNSCKGISGKHFGFSLVFTLQKICFVFTGAFQCRFSWKRTGKSTREFYSKEMLNFHPPIYIFIFPSIP